MGKVTWEGWQTSIEDAAQPITGIVIIRRPPPKNGRPPMTSEVLGRSLHPCHQASKIATMIHTKKTQAMLTANTHRNPVSPSPISSPSLPKFMADHGASVREQNLGPCLPDYLRGAFLPSRGNVAGRCKQVLPFFPCSRPIIVKPRLIRILARIWSRHYGACRNPWSRSGGVFHLLRIGSAVIENVLSVFVRRNVVCPIFTFVHCLPPKTQTP